MTAHAVPTVVPGPDGLNRRAFSADDVRRMTEAGILGEHDPFELIDGELIEMAAKGFAHDRTKMALAAELFASLDRATFYIAVECTVRLDATTLLEPDILVCRQEDVRRSSEGYVEVAGADILLVVEIADSSLRYDKVRKASVYAAHDIADYWIADLNAQQMIVHRRPGRHGYGETMTVGEDQAVRPSAAALAGISVRLSDLG